jgi:hypothetical protein
MCYLPLFTIVSHFFFNHCVILVCLIVNMVNLKNKQCNNSKYKEDKLILKCMKQMDYLQAKLEENKNSIY